MGFGRVLDIVFFLYFLTHIPITILIDSQAVLPKEWYPEVLRQTVDWYCKEFKDPMMKEPPVWFKSFCVFEIFVQFPFFFVATYAFGKGRCAWIRLPALTYGAHVATTVLPILAHILFYDFSTGRYPGPSTPTERYTLAAVYAPYLVIPLIIVLRMLFSPEFSQSVKKNNGKPPPNPKKDAKKDVKKDIRKDANKDTNKNYSKVENVVSRNKKKK